MSGYCRLIAVASLSVIIGGPSTVALADEGVPSPQPQPILGGDVVEPCGFPTAVSMGGSCTGTLVHPRLVVYAAHCGDDVPWIRFGDRIEDAPGFEVVPQMCQTHPVGQFGFGTDAAFCRLAEPVEGIPIAPPLMGCEADAALQVGQPVTVAGYGTSDDELEPYGIKRYLDTQITALSWDEVFIGGEDEGVCYGDSGGPTYARTADGSWRSFGITSWGQPGCGFG
ncbi:MAG: trypsin-like serine protease, partial [Deltaproteobacteria bacterium]|nr:trypsin-like serine protease [Deltaproteobacteria bacterium]